MQRHSCGDRGACWELKDCLGAPGGGLGQGQWGLGQGHGCLQGVGLQSWAPGRPTAPASRWFQSQDRGGEGAGRGLLESCLLSPGLISKTGRLALTEALDGTAMRLPG